MDYSFIMIFILIFLLTTLKFGETTSTTCKIYQGVTADNVAQYIFYKTNCCKANLDVFKPSPDGKFPEKPKILQLTDFLQNGRKGIKTVWNANFSHLKGFKIEYEYKDTGVKICRILDFSEFLNETKSIDNYNFDFEIHPIPKNKTYLVHLYSLPESANNYLFAGKVDTLFCREWTAAINYGIKEGKLNVEFEQGPSKCNIKMYKVSLYYANSTNLNEAIVNSSKTTTKLTHNFLGVCPGSYYITVEIYDEHPFTNCICVNINKKCGEGCTRTRTKLIEKFGPSCLKVTTTTILSTNAPPTPPKLTIFLAVVGAMVGLIFIGLTIFCLKRALQEKRGLIFYTDDNLCHCKAIDEFISFMDTSKCKLQVAAHVAKTNNPLKLNFEIQKSDFIILVYSKALQKRIQAWKNNQDYINFLKEDNSALLTVPLLKELSASNKLIICKFPHAPNSTISSEFPSVKCYTLTKELNLLIQQIHGTGVDQELAILAKSSKLNRKFNTLTNAIKNAVNFEENSSNWFAEKYFCPKKIESLNEMPDDTEKFVDGNGSSIMSIAVSDKLEQMNIYNDTSA